MTSVEKINSRNLFNNIVKQFEGNSELLGIYAYILLNVEESEDFLTSLYALEKGLGKERSRIIQKLTFLSEMDLITFKVLSKTVVITNRKPENKRAFELAFNNTP